MSLGQGDVGISGGGGGGVGTTSVQGLELTAPPFACVPVPLLQKRKSMTKLRGPNPKSSRTTLQSKSVRSPSQEEGPVQGPGRGRDP